MLSRLRLGLDNRAVPVSRATVVLAHHQVGDEEGPGDDDISEGDGLPNKEGAAAEMAFQDDQQTVKICPPLGRSRPIKLPEFSRQGKGTCTRGSLYPSRPVHPAVNLRACCVCTQQAPEV